MLKEIFILITLFIIYSFIGWIIESTYKSVLQKKIVNSGFLAGPFCPIYGFGALIMYLSLKDVSNNILVLFSYGIVVLSVFEYVVGLFLEIVFKTKYWDYSKKKFNIQGRVCLQNSIYWGILGVVFMRLIHPGVESIIRVIPQKYLVIAIGVGGAYILTDTISTVVKLIKINIKLKDLEKIGEEIREKIESIKVKTEHNIERIHTINKINKYGRLRNLVKAKRKILSLQELHEKQVNTERRLYRKLKRYRKAFPTMHSERLSNFLNNYKKS